MDYQLLIGVIYLIFSALLFFTGTVIFRENPYRRLNRVTSLLLIFAGLAPLFAALGVFLGRTAGTVEGQVPFYENLFFLWELFFPQLVLFSLVFPTEHPILSTNTRVKYLIFIPHVFHILLVTLFADTGKIVEFLQVESDVAFFGWVTDRFAFFVGFIAALLDFLVRLHLQTFAAINIIYIIIALVLLYRGLRHISNKRLKTQTLIVIWGIQSAMGLYMIAYLLPNLSGLQLSPNVQIGMAVAALAIGNGSVIYAIIRYQFLDVRLIVRQSVVYTITSAIIVGAYLLIISQFTKILQDILGRETPILPAAFIILALIFFQPIMNQVDNFLKKFFIKGKVDIRYVADEISREISSILDPEKLKTSIMRILREEMLIEKVRLCMKSDDGAAYVLLPQPNDPAPEMKFSPEDQLTENLLRRNRPALIDEFRGADQKSKTIENLEKMGYQMIVPLINRGELDGFIALSNKISGYNYNYEDITTLNILSNQLVVAMSNARLYQESLEKQRLEEELSLARQIQRDLLPKTVPVGDDFEMAAYSEPSRYVGGDFYDFLQTRKNNTGIIIADVSGKGMPAALMVSQIQAMLRSEVRNTDSIIRILNNVNFLMSTTTSAEKFVTLFYAEYDPIEKTMEYSNAGHNYPIVVNQKGEHRFLIEGGLLMGAFKEATYKQDSLKLNPGDLVFFYTDGINEAFNHEGEQFGEERLLELIKEIRSQSAKEIADRVVKEVMDFSSSDMPQDDMTVVALKLKAPA
ncbi:MAG: SpoIIE family protein phosphatase [Aliifodinibius sp.]|nr:SpoIIE family protein phosphatase [candidate division Zixibacteria bacterium]NIT58030.1 SpoIIE family protein phosphatase [Fodinibius sp.]NIW42081.1 SpoIIE family protein phosphatase [candidate division Zixibacteria bacterium]NIX56820.1 SpoIIE family protein phosphatase [candidate division Zixibacteria bacterium]NIY26612.1 SpoIIE family protein phosphatase [Fodinibius sp.]